MTDGADTDAAGQEGNGSLTFADGSPRLTIAGQADLLKIQSR